MLYTVYVTDYQEPEIHEGYPVDTDDQAEAERAFDDAVRKYSSGLAKCMVTVHLEEGGTVIRTQLVTGS